jgi:hypothetical protein
MNKCKIFRDFDTDRVTRVLNNQGEESALYKAALAQTKDQEQALDIWSVTSLPRFEEYAKDLNLNGKEAKLSDVLKFINNLNTTETLSNQDLVELSNNLQTLNVENGDNFLSLLQQTFYNATGLFEVNRQKLRNSGLYTEAEINNIMTFPSLRANIKEFINKIRNTLKGDNQLPNLFTDNTSYNDFVIQDSSTYVGIGKFKNYLPEEVRDYLLKNIRSFTTDVEFKAKLQALDNIDIRDYVLDNSDVYNYVKDLVNNSKVVPVFTETDGMVVPKLDNDLVPAILNTIRIGEPKDIFTMSVDNVRVIPVDNWYQNEAVPTLLKDLELQAAINHIDLYGLAQSYTSKSREEILGILDVVDDFLYKAELAEISNTDIYDLGNDISEFFGQEVTQAEITIPISETDKGRNLSIIDTSLSEIDLYQSDGFIKFRDNLYQKATVYDSFNTMAEDTYNALLDDITILPDSVLESLQLKTNGNYNFAYLLNPANQTNILSKINELVAREMDSSFTINSNEEFDAAKQITLYKSLLKVPTIQVRKLDISDFMTRKAVVDIDNDTLDYLTSDFISDFYAKYLQEKVLESPLFDAAYKYFEVTNRGIVFNNTNPLIKNQVLTLMAEDEMFPVLQAYSAISKEDSLEFLMPEQIDETLIDIQDRRDFVVNHPEYVQKFVKPFTQVDPTTLVVKNSLDEFLKLNNGLYELTDFRNGVSIYSLLNNVADPNFYVFNSAKPVVNIDVNIETYESSNTDLNLTNKSKVSQSVTDKLLETLICS